MWVGQVMLMVTNKGKRVDLEDMVKSPRGGTDKAKMHDSPLKKN